MIMDCIETLCRIRDINRAIIDYEIRLEKEYGLCLNEGMLLCSLNKTSELSSGEIAEALGLTPSNASKVICSVEKKALIRRVIGKKDKRQMYFSLTTKGREKLQSVSCSGIEVPELLRIIITSEVF